MTLDLRYLDFKWHLSPGSDGVVPKAQANGKFYKASNFNRDIGFYGYSAMNDVVATNYLRAVGIPALQYQGAEALIVFEGKEYETFIAWSLDYRDGRVDIPFEALVQFERIPHDQYLQYARGLDSVYIDRMIVADYLVGNRDRHGKNIRWLGDSYAPLFDYNLSLFMPDGTARGHNIMANNFLGSPYLKDNLKLVEHFPETNAPYWPSVFHDINYPFINELKVWLEERRHQYEEIRNSLS